jgi:hypothetical protein
LRGDRNASLEAAKEENQAEQDASAIRIILNDYEITAIGIKRDILDESVFEPWQSASGMRGHMWNWRNWRLEWKSAPER